MYTSGTKLKEASFIIPNINCQNITEINNKAQEEVDILKTGPKTIFTNELEEDLQLRIIGMQ